MREAPIFFPLIRLAVLASAVAALSGCGQKGPLIHPDKDAGTGKKVTGKGASKPPAAKPQSTAPATPAAKPSEGTGGSPAPASDSQQNPAVSVDKSSQ